MVFFGEPVGVGFVVDGVPSPAGAASPAAGRARSARSAVGHPQRVRLDLPVGVAAHEVLVVDAELAAIVAVLGCSDEQEMSVLCLHVVQAAMVYVNTLMIQDVLAEPDWARTFTPTDYRGLTPLIWAHVAMHGEFKLNMNTRLTLGSASPLPSQ